MFVPVRCNGERHALGGDGIIYYARFEDIAGELVDKYGGGARVVYIDPPFGTGGAFEYRRGKKQIAYADKLGGDDFYKLMLSAVKTANALLKEDGTFFLHIDYRMSHVCRGICDEVFGANAFTNEIIWAYKSGGRSIKSFSKKHDAILMYRKSPKAYFDILAVGAPRGAQRRNHMKRRIDSDGRVFYSIKSGSKEYRYYEDDLVYPSDVWDDIEHLHQRDPERTGFTTQKPVALLKRIILACSQEGDTVVDLFGGSGTTAAASVQLGRRFVTVDCGRVALSVMRKRLLQDNAVTGIFRERRPLDIEYRLETKESADFVPQTYFEVEYEADGAWLKPLNIDKNAAPMYAAAGTVREGRFIAESYMLGYKLGARLFVGDGGTLHIEDEECRSAFFQYQKQP